MSDLPDFDDDDAWNEIAEEAIEAAFNRSPPVVAEMEAPHSGVTADRTEES